MDMEGRKCEPQAGKSLNIYIYICIFKKKNLLEGLLTAGLNKVIIRDHLGTESQWAVRANHGGMQVNAAVGPRHAACCLFHSRVFGLLTSSNKRRPQPPAIWFVFAPSFWHVSISGHGALSSEPVA